MWEDVSLVVDSVYKMLRLIVDSMQKKKQKTFSLLVDSMQKALSLVVGTAQKRKAQL